MYTTIFLDCFAHCRFANSLNNMGGTEIKILVNSQEGFYQRQTIHNIITLLHRI